MTGDTGTSDDRLPTGAEAQRLAEAARLRRHRRVILVVGGLAALLLTAWWALASSQTSRVDVTWAGPMACAGTEVVTELPEGEDVYSQGMRLRPGMRCSMPLRVENRGVLGVDVERLRLAFLGPQGGAAVRGHLADAAGDRVPRVGGGIDAQHSLAVRLSRGEAVDLVVQFRFRPDGCSSSRSVTTVGPLAEVEVSALGLGRTRAPEGLVAFYGTRHSSC